MKKTYMHKQTRSINMKGIVLIVLLFISISFSYDIKGHDFYFEEGVTCYAEHRIYTDDYAKFIIIQCDNNYKFEVNADYLASRNWCYVTKVAGKDTIKYGHYYVKDYNNYEYVKDEYGTEISVKQVNLDCVDIYKKFKSKIVGRIRTGTFKCNDGGCYTYYDDGTKVKHKY